jgi:hypothetical protein
MSEWSKKSAQTFQATKDERLVKDRKALQDEGLCKRLAPEIWQKLVNLFKQKCSEFNGEPGMVNTFSFSAGMNDFLVTQGTEKFKAKFNSGSHQLHFDSSTWNPHQFGLEIRVADGRSQPELFFKSNPVDPESFANDHLESLLGIGQNSSRS